MQKLKLKKNNNNKANNNKGKTISKQVKNKQPRKTTRMQFLNSRYLTSLLNPEQVNDAKIPGSAVPVVAIHRRIIQRYTTNANGCIAINFTPENSLHENTVLGTTVNVIPVRVCNDGSYTGTVAPAVGTLVTQSATNPFSLPEGTCKQYRLVSACMTVRSLASALNRSGDIHIALVNGQYNLSNYVVATTDEVNFCALSNIDNLVQGKYTYARVENGQSARAIWIPQDVSCLDFKDINANPVTTDNFITAIGIGLAASSSVEVVLDFNFEVTAKVGSMLQGMESFCLENIDPLRVWRTAYSIRPPCIASKDIGLYHATAITQMGLKPSADIFSRPSALNQADIAAANYADNWINNNFKNPALDIVMRDELRR